ncbi:hypothetical protein BJ138DRAFT_1176726 [Hygrophoropsis aurantiaca]|uniref:Uncharacterized protein n=1 Tax=Hygrophoropsis aurantiaca TaxID=72124 RepID=A0ACB8AQZ0_9AGAM|nr:hypothetical protein BJ138DRAFT_1176726 [Hygrophoropsis aurantiaca]
MATANPPMAPVGTVGIDLSPEFNALYVGITLAVALTGITVVQAWTYVNDNMDSWILRSFVALLLMADIGTTFLDVQVMHNCLITNFGNLAPLAVTTKEGLAEFILTLIVVFLVQGFFVTRIYMLQKEKWWNPVIILLFATVALGTGAVALADLVKHPSVLVLATAENKIMFSITGSFSAVADIMITASLTMLLSSAKTGMQRTNTVLQKLIVFIVSRGLMVSVTQVLFLIVYLIRPDRLWWVPLHFISSKLYVITMVAMLNERSQLRSKRGGIHTSNYLTDSVANTHTPSRVVVHTTIELNRYPKDDNCDDSAIAENHSKEGPEKEASSISDSYRV